jgi:hypothetical protein
MKLTNILIATSLVLASSLTSHAQVGIGTATPAASAALDLTSTTKGFLPPRMTAAQQNAITAPAQGLMVYCTNCGTNGEAQLYNGTSWVNLLGGAATPGVGSSYGGGIVAYIFVSGDPGYVSGQVHGLVATSADISTGITWGCNETPIPGGTSAAIGTGAANTATIMAGCSTAGIAARLCGDLVEGGYSDWYLPSLDELNKLFLNRVAIGGFNNNNNIYYWSSTECANNCARIQRFTDGAQLTTYKASSNFVRAVRSF